MSPLLRLDHVSKVYRIGTFGGKELRAVDDVTFDIEPGEVVSLIGESGSGKTTIGKMILGLISVTSGSVSFDGRDVAHLSGRDRREYYRSVQGVFQDPFSSYNPVFKADRVFDIVRHAYFPHVPDADWNRKVEAALESVGLDPPQVLGRFPHQLSGGQLQRLLIARALLLDIRFLVADEIISMLDASTRVDVLNLLADLKARGLSILFVTHDLSLGYYISDRAVILYRGTVVEMGTTGDVFANPCHPYTKMLLESVPHIDRKWATGGIELRGERGELAAGCVYAARCPMASDALGCRSSQPSLVEIADGHHVACFLHRTEALNGSCDFRRAGE